MSKQAQSLTNLHFILGGARSGKSRLALASAQQIARDTDASLIFIATATANDEEMRIRIKKHQAERISIHGENPWALVEEPVHLASALLENDAQGKVVLVDCLTLWISNCLHLKVWDEEKDALLNCLEQLTSTVIFVSNETGLGIVPMGELTRQYVDASGFFHQRIAQRCAHVVFTVAGLPHVLKDER
jgi:adenosylcobinamide kinase/adenosylcobinamide-phosphate guanylyltransferase